MRTSVVSTLVIALSLFTAMPRAYAQARHTAPQSALDAALQSRVDRTTTERQEVLRVLDSARVKAVAAQTGIDLQQARNAVGTLDPAQLSQVATQARQVNNALAGGASTVVISTTTIIIGLLLLILIIVAT